MSIVSGVVVFSIYHFCYIFLLFLLYMSEGKSDFWPVRIILLFIKAIAEMKAKDTHQGRTPMHT